MACLDCDSDNTTHHDPETITGPLARMLAWTVTCQDCGCLMTGTSPVQGGEVITEDVIEHGNSRVCGQCGGSGGGSEPHLSCPACHGSGLA